MKYNIWEGIIDKFNPARTVETGKPWEGPPFFREAGLTKMMGPKFEGVKSSPKNKPHLSRGLAAFCAFM
jgi:hypothetical protein